VLDSATESFPRRTLASLGAGDVLVIASFAVRAPRDARRFPGRTLPLSLRDATRVSATRYRLRARAGGYWVDATVDFGETPSPAVRALADGQLARVVVPPVTIAARRSIDPTTGFPVMYLVGRIGRPAAHERVTVLAKECGPVGTGYRQLGDERTTTGGSWRFGPVEHSGPTFYRARWGRSTSKPLFVTAGLATRLRVSGRTLVVEVDTRATGQRMGGESSSSNVALVAVGRNPPRPPDGHEVAVPRALRDAARPSAASRRRAAQERRAVLSPRRLGDVPSSRPLGPHDSRRIRRAVRAAPARALGAGRES